MSDSAQVPNGDTETFIIPADSGAAAPIIHRHRHDLSWREPILHFFSTCSAAEATFLIQTAILAQGEGAAARGFKPSLHETILHRDLLLAVRYLGAIPGVEPILRCDLMESLCQVYFDLEQAGKYRSLQEQILAGFGWLYQGDLRDDLVSFLKSRLRWGTHTQHLHACKALIFLGAEFSEVSRVVVELSRAGNARVKAQAIKYVGILGIGTPEVVTDLLQVVRDHNRQVAWTPGRIPLPLDEVELAESALETLGKLGLKTPEVVSGLLEGFNQSHWCDVIRKAAEALGRIGIETPGVKAGLESALSASGHESRMYAARVLLRAGVELPDFISQVLEDLKFDDNEVQTDAAEILGYLGLETPEIVAGLRQAWERDRVSAAAEALGKLRVQAPEVVNPLVATLSRNVGVVSQALGKIGVNTPETVPALLAELGKPIGQQRDNYPLTEVAEALGRFGEASPEVVSQLVRLLKNDWWHTRLRAAEALARLNVATPNVVAGLQRALLDDPALRDDHDFSQAGAALALAHLIRQQPDCFNQKNRISIARTIADILPFVNQTEIRISLFDQEYAWIYDAYWEALFMVCQTIEI